MLEIAENATGIQYPENFGIERPFARVYQMVNGETRNNCIKPTHVGQRLVQIMSDDVDSLVARKTMGSGFQHSRREVERDRLHVRMLAFDQSQQAAIAGAKIEHSPGRGGNKFKQRRLAFAAMRNRIGTAYVIARMLGR